MYSTVFLDFELDFLESAFVEKRGETKKQKELKKLKGKGIKWIRQVFATLQTILTRV